MEFCHQGDLNREIKKRKNEDRHFEIRELILHYLRLADCIKCLHDHNICHRDIKPHNIFITKA